jgi:hypothetical protein
LHKDKLLYMVPELICWTDETRILPSGSDAVVMWASGLGLTQTTPSTSTQAAPAPRIDCDMKVRMFNTWLDLLTNPLTEGFYDC